MRLVLLAALAVTAFFLASAIGLLGLGPAEIRLPDADPIARHTRPGPSAAGILGGGLFRKAAPAATRCDDVSLVSTVVGETGWSFAALGERGRTRLRREGDLVGDRQVVLIAWNEVRLAGGAGECTLALFDRRPVEAVAGAPDGVVEIDRGLVERLLADPAELPSLARVRPRGRGFALSGVEPDGPLAAAGVRTGDVLLTVDGRSLRDPNGLLEVWDRARRGETVTLGLRRGGRAHEIRYRLR